MNNNKINRKSSLNAEPTVFSTQYISTDDLKSQEIKILMKKD